MTGLGLLVRRREFGLVWLGGLISIIGDWVLWIALPIHVFELTGSAFATALLVAFRVAPEIVFGTIAGVLVDRWDRRRVLVAANLLQAVALVPLLFLTDVATVWIAYPVMAVSAVLFSFSQPAENAYLPRLVPSSELQEANALNALNNSLARLVGPAAGGLLYLVVGLGGVALVDAATFLAGAALVGLVRTPGVPERAGGEGLGDDASDVATGALRRLAREWVDGVRAIRRSRVVSVILGVNAATAIGEGVFAVMFLIWVERTLLGGAPEYGSFMSAQAIGGVAGGLVAGWFARRLPPRRLFGLGLVVFGVLDGLLFNYPLVVSGAALGLVLMAVVGMPGVALLAARQTLIQRDIPDRYLGRVFSALGTTSALLMLGSTLVVGVVGERTNPIAALNVQALAYIASGIGVLWLLRDATDERGTLTASHEGRQDAVRVHAQAGALDRGDDRAGEAR